MPRCLKLLLLSWRRFAAGARARPVALRVEQPDVEHRNPVEMGCVVNQQMRTAGQFGDCVGPPVGADQPDPAALLKARSDYTSRRRRVRRRNHRARIGTMKVVIEGHAEKSLWKPRAAALANTRVRGEKTSLKKNRFARVAARRYPPGDPRPGIARRPVA